MDSEKSRILVLVEGAKTDCRLMEHLLHIYGIDGRHQIISYDTNIYVLYNQVFRDSDPASVDILQMLKEHEPDAEKKKFFDQKYSDILLIFDLDPQDPQFSPEKITSMTEYFTESSDMGKLYLNYPMVEAFYHMKSRRLGDGSIVLLSQKLSKEDKEYITSIDEEIMSKYPSDEMIKFVEDEL